MDRIGDVGDRASKGKAVQVHGTGFTAGSLARVGTRGGTRGPGIKVISEKELTEVGRMKQMVEGGGE